ncbi:hypothetical protein [Rathayibacter toxicus]|uniref:hypothetical protein n=1 Tax=Rathayibacter toxicus TaxID=145458 RepID=UPI000D459A69|nr:hypothetical protein [Rathayibacter toxicus]PPI56828.1 hypothetical protein C5D35_00860 [Rathayibacter toxicus]QWL29075.1 hypothetical protein E2R33_10995 [Rathayibacter toxicus]
MPTTIEFKRNKFFIRRNYDADLRALAPVADPGLINSPAPTGFISPLTYSSYGCEWTSPHGTPLAALLGPPYLGGSVAFTPLFTGIGTSLRQFHGSFRRQDVAASEKSALRPRSLLRTCAWVGRAWGNARAATALQQLEARLSLGEWRAVHDAVNRIHESFIDSCGTRRTVVGLGGLSLANVLITPEDPSSGWAVLAGPDTCLSPMEYDVGFFLGELAEHAFVYAAAGLPFDDFSVLAASFLSGYGATEDSELIASAIIFRFLLHILDFSHFVGEIGEWCIYAELVRFFIDSPLEWISGY